MPDRANSDGSADPSIAELAGGAIDPRITLRVRQQPVSAQVCRRGERRPSTVDPMPVIQLTTEGLDLPSKEQPCDRHILTCTYTNTESGDEHPMPAIATLFVGKDEHGVEGYFFTFPDLYFYSAGSFRLTFSMVTINPNLPPELRNFPVLAKATSDPFTVYSVEDFPGVRAATALTEALKEGMEASMGPPARHGGRDLSNGKQDEDEAK